MPFFSIVIPTYNRPAQLTVCLQACARLDYPRFRFEVICAAEESVQTGRSMSLVPWVMDS
jgi:glycosyltransferase involved in cell wall biosynthesis